MCGCCARVCGVESILLCDSTALGVAGRAFVAVAIMIIKRTLHNGRFVKFGVKGLVSTNPLPDGWRDMNVYGERGGIIPKSQCLPLTLSGLQSSFWGLRSDI